ncbi:hypothetical protein NC652_023749 [Populus alba x Populus x berolinensis]|nr:hypothetical protein NC652_023749 [Populus alba x Populus x berolinensis]
MGVFLCSRGPNLMRFNLGRTKKNGFGGQLYDNIFWCYEDREKLSSFSVHFPALPASVVTLASIYVCYVRQSIAGSYHLIKAVTNDARSIYSAAKVLFHESMHQPMINEVLKSWTNTPCPIHKVRFYTTNINLKSTHLLVFQTLPDK